MRSFPTRSCLIGSCPIGSRERDKVHSKFGTTEGGNNNDGGLLKGAEVEVSSDLKKKKGRLRRTYLSIR
jgi:hypothetical protein